MCDEGKTRGSVYSVELVYAFANLVVSRDNVSVELIFFSVMEAGLLRGAGQLKPNQSTWLCGCML